MIVVQAGRAPRTRAGNTVRLPLPAAARKTVLLTHIAAAGGWFGIDLVVGVLILVGWLQTGTGHRDDAWQPLATWFLLPALSAALVAGLICLVSGVVLGLATRWGLLRYWWVALKLALNTVMCLVLPAFLFNPFREIASGDAPLDDLTVVLVLAALALLLIVVALVLSVFKPGGRVWLPQRNPRAGAGEAGSVGREPSAAPR